MYLGQGLYVTAMGMGLVFLSLAILLFAIVALDRIFPARDEADKEPSAESPATDPARAPASVPAAAREFEAAVAGKHYAVALADPSNELSRVIVDGTPHDVNADAAPNGNLVIDGRSYRVQVLDAQSGRIRVRVEGTEYEVDLPETPPSAALAPSAAAEPAGRAPGGEGETVPAPLPGKILRIVVAPGARVERGQELLVLEAMKMENSIRAHRPGVVQEVRATAGQSVAAGQPLIILA